jgi:hypothetical protein
METWTTGVLVTEDNEVKSQEGQQPSTYEEKVVREETLLARRQESLDSVHLGSHGYEAGYRRESKLLCVVISVSKTPFVVVDVFVCFLFQLSQRLGYRMETFRATLKPERQGLSQHHGRRSTGIGRHLETTNKFRQAPPFPR